MNSPMVDMKKHGMTLVASVICVLVILFDTSLPREIIDGAKTNIGKVFMALILIALFATTHPIAGVLAIIAFWKLSVSESYNKSVSFKEPEKASASTPSEGVDDMPAHIKSLLTNTNLTLTVLDGKIVLGTWQGIFIWEHRIQGNLRELVISIFGEE